MINLSNPAISILLPFYNTASTLAQCLDSILNQTFTNFELLAINNGSTDDSVAVVVAKMGSDPRLKLLNLEKAGLIPALNLGLQEAKADIIARMDGDDVMHATRLEKQIQYLKQNSNCSLVACKVDLFPKELIKEGYWEYIRWQNSCITAQDIRDEIYWESPLAHPSVTFVKKDVLALGGYRDGAFPEDYDLWLRMNQAGFIMEKLPETLLDWREGSTRLSRNDPRYNREAFDVIRAEFLSQDSRLKQNRPLVVWGAGRSTRLRAKHLLDKGFKLTAWIDVDNNKIGNKVWGAMVHSPQWLKQKEKPFVLSYVTVRGAKEKNRQQLEEMGYKRGLDYLMVG
ncbi:MAG: glycosyltransferase [Magnetococcales bacterium]|nr:glycosyltransferase [Magnetococcales bacterium]